MGAWGHGIMQNDTALDFQAFWDDYVVRGIERDPEFWTLAQVDHLVLHGRFRGSIAYGDPDIRAELLAAAVLYRKAGLPLEGRLHHAVERAASMELMPDELKEYRSPGVRRRALLKFLETFGMKQQSTSELPPPQQRHDALRSEVEKWIPFSARYEEWVEVSRQPFAHEPFFELVPHWFMGLQSYLGRGVRNDDAELENQGKKFRLMCLAFYTGFLMRLPDDERLRLIRKVEQDWEEMHFLPMPW